MSNFRTISRKKILNRRILFKQNNVSTYLPVIERLSKIRMQNELNIRTVNEQLSERLIISLRIKRFLFTMAIGYVKSLFFIFFLFPQKKNKKQVSFRVFVLARNFFCLRKTGTALWMLHFLFCKKEKNCNMHLIKTLIKSK